MPSHQQCLVLQTVHRDGKKRKTDRNAAIGWVGGSGERPFRDAEQGLSSGLRVGPRGVARRQVTLLTVVH